MTAPDELQRAVERVDRWANYEWTTADQIAVKSELSTFTAGDLRLLLSERAELLATVERMRGALWPFAQVKPTAESGFVNICALNVDVIAARAALTTGEGK